MGGDLRHLDDWTLSLLTHKELLAIHRHSRATSLISWRDPGTVWPAAPQNPRARDCRLQHRQEGSHAAAAPSAGFATEGQAARSVGLRVRQRR